MEKYQILKDLIKFNTVQDKQNTEILDYIEELLKAKGFKTNYRSKVLIMSYGENPSFGFLGHTDTVEYIDGWDTDPFTLSQKDNALYGLGVCDMKGGIAAMLDAILNTDLDSLKNGIKLYFTYDEELDFNGINELVNNDETFPDFMVFGEPTDNELIVGCKGLLECDLFFKGLKAHSSTPDKGISANLNAVRFLSELEAFYLSQIKNQVNESFEIPYTTMNVGILKGGSAKNSIPADCYATLDFRLTDSKHADLLLDKMSELCKKYNCENVVIQNIKPFINKIDLENNNKTANYMTEASFMECKSKVILGVGPVTAHEVNEHIETKSYEKLVKQYEELINKFA
jgi:acetylornithine deacetylase